MFLRMLLFSQGKSKTTLCVVFRNVKLAYRQPISYSYLYTDVYFPLCANVIISKLYSAMISRIFFQFYIYEKKFSSYNVGIYYCKFLVVLIFFLSNICPIQTVLYRQILNFLFGSCFLLNLF